MKNSTIFFLCTFFFFFSSLVYADDFYLTQDYSDSEVFVTTLLSIEELSVSENEFYTIDYNFDSLIGKRTNTLEGNVLWEDHIQMVDGRYRRVGGVNDSVWIPGNSRVAVSALIKNESEHDVTLKDWKFFVSRSNTSMSNYGIFGVNAVFGYDYYNFFNNNLVKSGDFVTSSLVTNVQKDESKLVKLNSFDIFQPLEVEYFNWEPNISDEGDLIIDFILKLNSIASFRIPNVEFKHGDFSFVKTFNAGDSHVYEYQINYGKDYKPGLNLLDSFEIKKEGIKTECIVLGSNNFFDSSPNTKTLVYKRSDIDGGEGWFGKSVDVDWYPRREAMCITLMGYNLVGKPLEYLHPLNVDLKFLSNVDVLSLGDDLVLNLKIRNNGMDLNSLDIGLDFDGNFQKLKEADCDFKYSDDGILINFGTFVFDDELSCELIFEILEEKKLLFLKNGLSFEGENLENIFVAFIPDVENFFYYDYLLKDFVFESNSKDISFLSSVDYSFEGLECREVSLFGLKDEICI